MGGRADAPHGGCSVSAVIPTPRESFHVLGHEAAERTFLDAWNAERLAHAWLLSGPKGIGKASFAYAIARFVLTVGNSRGGKGGLLLEEPVPTQLFLPETHPVVRRVTAGSHADLKVIERGFSDDKKTKLRSEIIAEDVRGISGFMALTPGEGGWRVVIIDAADEMNRHAANAVLKVLEEPPRNALLLLVSHRPGALLPTIRSRCRHLALNPLGNDVVTTLLQRFFPELDEEDVGALARLGQGSAGKALALAQEGGLELYRAMIAVIEGMPGVDVEALHGFADRFTRPEADGAWRMLIELLDWWLARLIRAGGIGVCPPEIVPGEAALLQRLLSVAGLEQWLDVWENVTSLFGRAEGLHLDRKQTIVSAFFMMERLTRA